MTYPQKIMTAVDLSDYSAAIVRYSVELAMKLEAELLLINVINQRDLDMVQRTMLGYDTFSYPNYIAKQEQQREVTMKELFRAVSPDDLRCRFIVKNGIPYPELLEAIEEKKPNMIIVGSKGRSNLGGVVMGSTARKMFRRSPILLLMIPDGFNELP